jgi:transcriptional regulator with XRE-family HTH domain
MKKKMTVRSRVAVNIRTELARQHMSQTDLGMALGVSQGTVSRWVRCAGPLTIEDTERIAEVLDVRAEQLLGAS